MPGERERGEIEAQLDRIDRAVAELQRLHGLGDPSLRDDPGVTEAQAASELQAAIDSLPDYAWLMPDLRATLKRGERQSGRAAEITAETGAARRHILPQRWPCLLTLVALVAVCCVLALLFANGISRLIIPDPNEHSRSRSDMEFSLSRTGTALVVNAHGTGGRDLYYADLVTHTVRRIAATPDYETAPAISPNGKWIAYASGKPGEREDQLWLRSVDGAVVRQLTFGAANICSPRFYPSANRILFTRDTDYHWGGLAANWWGGGTLWSIKTDGSELRPVLPDLGIVSDPRLSRDGKWIVYMDGGIWVTRLDGTGHPKQVAGSDARCADFSPDGKRVVYVEGQYSTTMDIFTVPISGGKATKVLGAPLGAYYPHFTPDGKHILFQVETWPNGGSGDPQSSLWRVGLKGAPAVQIAGPVLFEDSEHASP